MASGGEDQLGQEANNVAERGEASAGGKRRGSGRGGTWQDPERSRGGRAAHMAGQRRRRAGEEKPRGGRER
jgi:hypothetical protein